MRKYREDRPERFTAGEEKALAEIARLKQDVDFLGKVSAFSCSEAAVEDFYEFIEAEKANHPIAWLCRY